MTAVTFGTIRIVLSVSTFRISKTQALVGYVASVTPQTLEVSPFILTTLTLTINSVSLTLRRIPAVPYHQALIQRLAPQSTAVQTVDISFATIPINVLLITTRTLTIQQIQQTVMMSFYQIFIKINYESSP